MFVCRKLWCNRFADARRNALKTKQILANGIGVLCFGYLLGPSAAGPLAQAPAAPRPQAAAPSPATSDSGPAPQRAVLDQYCNACHSLRARAAKLDSAVRLAFDDLDLNKVGEHPEIWEKVVRKGRAGLMPTTNARRPEVATLNGLAEWLENELDRSAETHVPAPGLHRLN